MHPGYVGRSYEAIISWNALWETIGPRRGKNTAMNRSAAINAIVKIEALLVQASKNRWILQRILPDQSVQRK